MRSHRPPARARVLTAIAAAALLAGVALAADPPDQPPAHLIASYLASRTGVDSLPFCPEWVLLLWDEYDDLGCLTVDQTPAITKLLLDNAINGTRDMRYVGPWQPLPGGAADTDILSVFAIDTIASPYGLAIIGRVDGGSIVVVARLPLD